MSYLKKQPTEPINQGMPHIYWDKGKFTTNPNNNVPNQPIIKNIQNPQIPPLIKEQMLIQRIKDWAFYIVVSMVVIYCLYRVFKGWLF